VLLVPQRNHAVNIGFHLQAIHLIGGGDVPLGQAGFPLFVLQQEEANLDIPKVKLRIYF
jgi:hypothetical protein